MPAHVHDCLAEAYAMLIDTLTLPKPQGRAEGIVPFPKVAARRQYLRKMLDNCNRGSLRFPVRLLDLANDTNNGAAGGQTTLW